MWETCLFLAPPPAGRVLADPDGKLTYFVAHILAVQNIINSTFNDDKQPGCRICGVVMLGR